MYTTGWIQSKFKNHEGLSCTVLGPSLYSESPSPPFYPNTESASRRRSSIKSWMWRNRSEYPLFLSSGSHGILSRGVETRNDLRVVAVWMPQQQFWLKSAFIRLCKFCQRNCTGNDVTKGVIFFVVSIDVNIPPPQPTTTALPCVRWKLFLLAQHNCDGNVLFYMTLNTSVCSTKSVCTSSRRHCVRSCIQTRQTLLNPAFLPRRILHLPLIFFCTYVFWNKEMKQLWVSTTLVYQWRTEGGGVFKPPLPKFRRPSKIVPNSTQLCKLLKKLLNLGRQLSKIFGKKAVKF